MAELVLSTFDPSSGSKYEYGDIIQARTRRGILCVHAQHICHINLAGFTKEGLRPSGSLARQFYQLTHQYIMERTGKFFIQRTDLFTGEVKEFGSEPDENGEYIEVEEYLERQLSSPNHIIFGLSGKEFWFGGRVDFSDKKMGEVWDMIESNSPKIRTDPPHDRWPASSTELKRFCHHSTEDFDDDTAERLMRPQLLRNDKGELAWRLERKDRETGERTIEIVYSEERPDEKQHWYNIDTKFREHRVDIDTKLDLDAAKLQDVKNQTVEVDLRGTPFLTEEIVDIKALDIAVIPEAGVTFA